MKILSMKSEKEIWINGGRKLRGRFMWIWRWTNESSKFNGFLGRSFLERERKKGKKKERDTLLRLLSVSLVVGGRIA